MPRNAADFSPCEPSRISPTRKILEEGTNMADNAQTAKDVLAAVGGKENVTNLIHCITRLRFSLKDESIPDVDAIKNIPGVIGAQWSGGQFQVIIGQNVTKVYDEVMKLGVTGGGSIDVDAGDIKKFEWTPKNVGNAILNYLSKTMVGLIPIMMGGAFFRVIAMVMGPLMLGVWSADSQIYQMFNTWMYDAAFFFMPIYLGYTAAETLGCSKVLGLLMGGILVCPDLVDLAKAGEVATMSVYGIPAPVANYGQTVLPIVLCMPVLNQVERFLKKVIPDMLSTVFVPFLTMFIMVPIAYCALGPLGSYMGTGIGAALAWFGDHGGFVAVAVLAALWEFLVMTGMHTAIFGIIFPTFIANGFEGFAMPAAGIAGWATWGMALGAFLRLKEKDEKGTMLGFVISGVIGGVTEPALYGCGFKYTRTFAGIVAGGLAGGLLAGLGGVKVYTMSVSNFLSVLGYIGGESTSNLVWGIIANVTALVVSAVVTYFFGFTKEQLEADRIAAAKA